MLVTPVPITLVTVVHPICGMFIERFPKMLRHFTDRNMVDKHIVVVNPANEWGSKDPAAVAFGSRVENAFAEVLPWNVQFIHSLTNRWDLPGYNDAFAEVNTPYWIGISPDTRLLEPNWLMRYFEVLETTRDEPFGMIGPGGPSRDLTPARVTDSDWGWIPRLLVDRGLQFDHCEHIQTWCFFMRSEAFVSAGKFWEPPDGVIGGKGDLITAEIYMSVCLRRAGYRIGFKQGPMLYHYGTNNGNPILDEIEAFDRLNNFAQF